MLFTTLVVTCVGDDADSKSPPLPPGVRAPSAWLGLGFCMRKPEASGVAHIPALPPGIGFVVQAVSAGGPAALSEIRPKDVLWKFADQLLVNQWQLAALLNLKKPGDVVVLAIFRDGKPAEIKVTLGEVPANARELSRDVVDAAILSDDSHPTRIITPESRTATLSDADGKALVRREGEGYQVVISGPDKTVLFDGVLGTDGNLDAIPAEWHRRIWVLRRSLDHALDSRMVPVRAPRPRVVPSPTPPSGSTQVPDEPSKF